MTFLTPAFLWGLAALSIPVAVHLFHFRRPQRLDVPTLRFVRAVEATAVRRLRLRQWLLLALRLGAVVALVLAFARPTQTAAAGSVFSDTGARSVAIVVDNSGSMRARGADGARLGEAQRVAGAVIEATGPGDDLALVTTAASARPVPFSAPGPALDALAALRPSVRAEALTASVARAASVLDGASGRREIVVVSDLQASTFSDSVRVALPRDVTLALVSVASRPEVNTAVTDARLASAIVEPGRPVRIEATVERFGGRPGSVATSLWIGGARVAEASVEVAPGTPATVSFETVLRSRGWTGAEVRIQPDGEATEWDDVRYVALHVPPPPRVLVVRGDGARSDRVTLALGIAAEQGGVSVSEIAEGSLATANLERVDVVLLVGLTRASAQAARALGAFSARGGGVVAFPGGSTEALNPLLAALGGGRIAGSVGETGGPSLGGLASTDLDHPVFAGVFDAAAPTVESPDVRRAVRYAPGRGDEQTLMQLAAGPPLLHEIRQGRGRTLLFGVAPDPAWSDLTERGLFLPLLLRSVLYVSSAPGSVADPSPSRSVFVSGGPADVRLLGPDGASVPANVQARAGGTLVSLGAATTAGVYRIARGDQTLRLVAVNDAARESDPEALDPSEAARRLEAATGRPVRVVDAAEARLGGDGARPGVPLWTWFLAFALVCLVAETTIATRWRPEAA